MGRMRYLTSSSQTWATGDLPHWGACRLQSRTGELRRGWRRQQACDAQGLPEEDVWVLGCLHSLDASVRARFRNHPYGNDRLCNGMKWNHQGKVSNMRRWLKGDHQQTWSMKEKTGAVETGKDSQGARITQKPGLTSMGYSKPLNAGGRANRMKTEVSH